MLKVDRIPVSAEQPCVGAGFDTESIQNADPLIPEIGLEILPWLRALAIETDMATVARQHLGDTQPGPVAAPVGNDDP